MPQPSISKPGSVAITKIGHTYDNRFGIAPMAKEKGASTPTVQTFGKGS